MGKAQPHRVIIGCLHCGELPFSFLEREIKQTPLLALTCSRTCGLTYAGLELFSFAVDKSLYDQGLAGPATAPEPLDHVTENEFGNSVRGKIAAKWRKS
jgi:hypothetical protein